MGGQPTLTRADIVNLLFIIAGAAFIGFGAIYIRLRLPSVKLPLKTHQFMYALGFVFFGALPLLAIESRTYTARVSSVLLTIALGFGLLLPPRGFEIWTIGVPNILAALITFFGGFLYLQYFVSNHRPIVLIVGFLTGLFYLYGVVYLILAVREQETLFFGIPLLISSGITFAFVRVFYKEVQKVSDRGWER
jgi:hypothetical protein